MERLRGKEYGSELSPVSDDSPKTGCIDYRPPWVHTVRGDAALREQVANWRMLTVTVGEKFMDVPRGASQYCRSKVGRFIAGSGWRTNVG